MTHDSFLQAILEAPDDDAPRLIYADWLEENGEPERAEYIRLEIERERLGEHHPRHGALHWRKLALESAHEEAWRRFLPDWAEGGELRRGFVEEMWLSAATL